MPPYLDWRTVKLTSLLLALIFFSHPVLVFAMPETASRKEAPADFTEFNDPFDQAPAGEIDDPLEPLNRAAFWLNDQLYTRFLRPACQAIPNETQSAAADFFALLGHPLEIGGVEFELKFRDAGSEIGRFVLHGVLGLLGRSEPEKMTGLAEGQEDFGRTLDAFGFGTGIYLVLPVFGPSSLRDGLGRITSFYLDPSPHLFRFAGHRPSAMAEESLLSELDTYEAIRSESLDPYLSIRNAYAQQREGEGKTEVLTMARPLQPSARSSSTSL